MSTGIIQKYLRWERKSKENCQKDFRLTTETETPWTLCDLKHGNWQKLVLRKISIWEGVQPELYIVFPPPHSPSCSGKISTDRSQGKKNCTIFLVKYWQNDCAYGRPYKRSTKGHNSHQSVRHWYSWPCRSYYALLLVTVQNIDVHLYSAVWLHALKPHARCVWQRGEGGSVTIREGKRGGGKEGWGMRGLKSRKQMWFQLPPKGSNVFLLGEASLAACFRGWATIMLAMFPAWLTMPATLLAISRPRRTPLAWSFDTLMDMPLFRRSTRPLSSPNFVTPLSSVISCISSTK